jgi:3-oxoacyl-[acyl-carrier protein] reductase
MSELKRSALITGAAGDIGAATALALARNGCNLTLVDIADLSAIADEVKRIGVEAVTCTADVSRRQDVQNALNVCLERFGRLDILANIAGFGGWRLFEDIPEDEWDRLIDVNLKGTFLFCQAALPPMRRQRYGRIVNIGSIVAKNGGNTRPWLGGTELQRTVNAGYAAAKGGVHALPIALAKQVAADGITVNAVAPGPIATQQVRLTAEKQKQIPVQRGGTPQDVARTVSFLAAEEGDYITGEIVDINGGLWMD